MSASNSETTWLDEHRVVGYLLIAFVSAAAVSGVGVVVRGEALSQVAVTGTVSFAVAFLGLLGWSYLFRKAGVET